MNYNCKHLFLNPPSSLPDGRQAGPFAKGGINVIFILVCELRAHVDSCFHGKSWIPHPPIAVEGRQVRNDKHVNTVVRA
jgi:hypothetical protein